MLRGKERDIPDIRIFKRSVTRGVASFNDDNDLNHSDVHVRSAARPATRGGLQSGKIYLDRPILRARRVDSVAGAKRAFSSKTRSCTRATRRGRSCAISGGSNSSSRRRGRRQGRNAKKNEEKKIRISREDREGRGETRERRSSTRCRRSCTARRKESGSSTLRLRCTRLRHAASVFFLLRSLSCTHTHTHKRVRACARRLRTRVVIIIVIRTRSVTKRPENTRGRRKGYGRIREDPVGSGRISRNFPQDSLGESRGPQ